jgi:hypothetical protein
MDPSAWRTLTGEAFASALTRTPASVLVTKILLAPVSTVAVGHEICGGVGAFVSAHVVVRLQLCTGKVIVDLTNEVFETLPLKLLPDLQQFRMEPPRLSVRVARGSCPGPGRRQATPEPWPWLDLPP